MSSVTHQEAEIGFISTKKLQIDSTSKSVTWSPSKKSKDIQILNGASTTKLDRLKAGTKAVLSRQTVLVGTSIDKFKLKIHAGTKIHVGLARSTRDVNTVDPGVDLISREYDVTPDSVMHMEMTATALNITYNNVISSLDVNAFDGESLHIWLACSVDGIGFSVSVSKDGLFCVSSKLQFLFSFIFYILCIV